MKNKFFICLFLFFLSKPVFATWELGVAGFYNDIKIEEQNEANSNTSYYLIENEESNRNEKGIHLYAHKVFILNNYFDLSMGPFFEYAKLKVEDEDPVGIDIKGKETYAIGFSSMLTFKLIEILKPYIKLGIASEWSEIDIETDISSPYVLGPNSTYTETIFGPVAHAGFGVKYFHSEKNIFFSEINYCKGYMSPRVKGTYNNTDPKGNNYYITSIKIMFGVSLRY